MVPTASRCLCGWLLAVWVVVPVAGQSAPLPPNILFILADDLGWRDTSVYGSPFYRTPNIDRLARLGMRFTQAYAANPLCSPTRASILTGLYPARIGITAPVCHQPQVVLQKGLRRAAGPNVPVLPAESLTRLDTRYQTLAEVLGRHGYVTGHFGKWHLGREPYSALQHGFQVDLPHWYGPGPAGSYVAPWRFPAQLGFTGKPGEHLELRMAHEAIAFMRQNRHRPFFLNYWAFSVHSPYDAPADRIAHAARRIRPDSPQRHPVMAAMIEMLDEGVGLLMEALEELELAERTIVIFFSDNGGVHWENYARSRARLMEEVRAGRRSDPIPPADLERVPITSNAPLRGGKATIYEGGTRVPCIVVWPGKIRPGTTTSALLSSVDFFPTILEMAGVPVPEGLALDGVSQVPVLRGEAPAVRQEIFCHFPHGAGVRPGFWCSTSLRQGKWKLIRFYGRGPGGADEYELYDLDADPGESRDVSQERGEIVESLRERMDYWLAQTQAVLPRPNPRFRPRAAREKTGTPNGG